MRGLPGRAPAVTAPQQNLIVESAGREDGLDEEEARAADADELPPELPGLDEALAVGDTRDRAAGAGAG